MPELPEIYLLGKYIDSTSLKKKIVELDFLQVSRYAATEELGGGASAGGGKR